MSDLKEAIKAGTDKKELLKMAKEFNLDLGFLNE